VLTPLDSSLGPVQIRVTNGSVTSAPFTVNMRNAAPAFLLFGGGKYVVATHANYTLLGPPELYQGLSTPAQPNEAVILYCVGFGLPEGPLTDGSSTQPGQFSTTPVITIGGIPATVQFAGLISPGLHQINVVIPAAAANGDNAIVAFYGGSTTRAGDLIT